MKIITEVLLTNYKNRIINIHPALLPSFKGAHGIEDAFNYGVKVFGVTIHYVSSELDGGKIIAQRGFEYYGKDIDELETKIHEVEHKLYPEVINKLLKGEM
jgi:phosphoribosylglycinamide formyltransferase-1